MLGLTTDPHLHGGYVRQLLLSQQCGFRAPSHFCCQFQMVQTYRSAKIQVGHRYGMSIKRKMYFYGKAIRGLEDVQLRTRENYIQYPP